MTYQSVYEIDKRSAEVCRDMQVIGFGFDLERALELSSHLQKIELATTDECCEIIGRPLKVRSGKDLHRAFIKELGAPIYFRSEKTGEPSLGVDTLRAYTVLPDERIAKLASAILKVRRARKLRSTYIDNAPVNPITGRIHPVWQAYGAVTGRWSCADPNLMNLPRAETDLTYALGGIRSLFVPKEGYVLVVFDMSQLEMRVAAFASGDPVMIAATESSDLHSANAKLIFEAEFDVARYAKLAYDDDHKQLADADKPEFKRLKALRTLAKSSGFAVSYGASATTVHQRLLAAGASVPLRRVEIMLRKLKRLFKHYYGWSEQNVAEAARTEHIATPITGRQRWVGSNPEPTECMNFPIQGGAADLMNQYLPILRDRVKHESPKSNLVAQVHDSGVFEVPESDVEIVRRLQRDVMQTPIKISSSGKDLFPAFPIDQKVTARWC
jgi:DNA polymerase-1